MQRVQGFSRRPAHVASRKVFQLLTICLLFLPWGAFPSDKPGAPRVCTWEAHDLSAAPQYEGHVLRLTGSLSRGVLHTAQGNWRLRCDGVALKRSIRNAHLEIDTARAANFADFTLTDDGSMILAGRSIVEPREVTGLTLASRPATSPMRRNECFDAEPMEAVVRDDVQRELAVLQQNTRAKVGGYVIDVWWCESRRNIRCPDIATKACYATVQGRHSTSPK